MKVGSLLFTTGIITATVIALPNAQVISPVYAATIQHSPSSIPVKATMVIQGRVTTYLFVRQEDKEIWVPIFALIQALDRVGVKSSWNKKTVPSMYPWYTNVWTVTAPNNWPLNVSSAPQALAPTTNQIAMQIQSGGQFVLGPRKVFSDPISRISTTYAQLTDVQAFLSRIGIAVRFTNNRLEVRVTHKVT